MTPTSPASRSRSPSRRPTPTELSPGGGHADLLAAPRVVAGGRGDGGGVITSIDLSDAPARMRPVRRHARPPAVRPSIPAEARFAAARAPARCCATAALRCPRARSQAAQPCPRTAARPPAGHAMPFSWLPWSVAASQEVDLEFWMDKNVRLGTALCFFYLFFGKAGTHGVVRHVSS